MAIPRVSIVPVGRVDPIEIEGAATRIAKALRSAVLVKETAPLPRGSEDVARGQHDAPKLLSALRSELLRLKTAKTVGVDVALVVAPPGAGKGSSTGPAPASGTPPPVASPAGGARPEVAVFVTDVDLFTPTTDGVWMHLDTPHRAGLVSVRRQREAFYRRKADPALQRTRLVKEILRASARLAGLPDCNDSKCVLFGVQAAGEIDRKQEHYCAACWKRMASGTMRI